MNDIHESEQQPLNESAALHEADSKSLLGAAGIPVVREIKAADAHSACQAALQLGYPVVLKALGTRLLHKSDRKLVHLKLQDAQQVHQAASCIAVEAGDDLEGLLVQPFVDGRRELVAGLLRDSQFGPIVMLGLGGVYTEALNDVVFRLAPLDSGDVTAMVGELRTGKLLGSFRNERPVDIQQLSDVLQALSRLALQHPHIAEVDINPLLIEPDGRLLALDALVVLRQPQPPAAPPPPVSPEAIGRLFHPRSIAFIGVSARLGKWGHTLFTNTVGGQFKGQIFLVNPKGGQMAGRPIYTSVAELPQPVDLAVVTIPAAAVLDLIPPLQAKGIRHMLLISSGFGEAGPEGRRREQELVRAARQAGILILGPNTMGICNPHRQLYCLGAHVRPRPGSTAMVSQSGNMGVQLLAFAEQQGIGIRGFSGSGNEAMITIEDYLEGFEVDETTLTVLLYLESVKDGRRFYESARRVGRRKPIILLKGGRSAAGHHAAASHTGAMGADNRIFDAMCRQAGIVRVDRPVDMLDLAAAFASLPLPRGKRVAIMTLGGGWGVVTADLCAEFNLDLPQLSELLMARFDKILPVYWSRANPVDIVGVQDPAIPLTVMKALLQWPGCDAVINLGIIGRRILLKRMIQSAHSADPDIDATQLASQLRALEAHEEQYIAQMASLMAEYQKPVFGVSLLTDDQSQTVYQFGDLRFKGVFYPTPERAVKALARMVEYARWREQEVKRAG